MKLAVSLLPVLLFLSGLTGLDSYKLVRFKPLVITLFIGCIMGMCAYAANILLVPALDLDLQTYSRYVAPVLEESLKAAYVVFLLQTRRAGFLVDAAIYGFALGAGFACVENMYLLSALTTNNPLVWMLRGFGTAIMHGSATAMFAVIAQAITNRSERISIALLPALLFAAAIHSVYNHFFFSPLISAIGVLFTMPPAFLGIYRRSESSLRGWLSSGFDSDQELLHLITTGDVSETKIGKYFRLLKAQFSGDVLVDMYGFLRLYLELAIRAKGLLLMKEAGFTPPPDRDVRAKFAELRALEKNIGPAGKLALSPFLKTTSYDDWQLRSIEE